MYEDDGAVGDLTIRGLPAKVRRTLATRAKARHLSLNAYIIERLTVIAETPETGEWPLDLDTVTSVHWDA